MRIVSGSLGGRTYNAPAGNRTHPMSEKVRGALFSVLGDIGGLTVVDAFSGSGALAFEAISRNASYVTAIDIDTNAINIINKNAQLLGVTNKLKVVRANIGSWSDNNPAMHFDIVLCDPPYDSVKKSLLYKVAAHTKIHGLVVFSLPPNIDFSLPLACYRQLSVKSYGDAQLVFYRKFAD